jgi:hypothetical protein
MIESSKISKRKSFILKEILKKGIAKWYKVLQD